MYTLAWKCATHGTKPLPATTVQCSVNEGCSVAIMYSKVQAVNLLIEQ